MDVSVALCTYNGERYIADQLDSILNQTHVPDEIVVRDDGSTDRTLEILNEYATDAPELFDIEQHAENTGVAKNFESAIRACTGDYIALSDQDDVWHEEKLARQLAALSESDAALACHNSTLVTDSMDPIGDLWADLIPAYIPESETRPTDTFRQLVRRNFVQGATVLLDAEYVDEILPLPAAWHHDYYLAIQACLRGGIIVLDDELLSYRQHEQQEVGGETVSILGRFLANLQEGYDSERVIVWNELSEWVTTQANADLAPDKSVIKPLLARKTNYEQARSDTLDGTSIKDAVSGLLHNIRRRHYTEFESGWLSAGNDITMILLSVSGVRKSHPE